MAGVPAPLLAELASEALCALGRVCRAWRSDVRQELDRRRADLSRGQEDTPLPVLTRCWWWCLIPASHALYLCRTCSLPPPAMFSPFLLAAPSPRAHLSPRTATQGPRLQPPDLLPLHPCQPPALRAHGPGLRLCWALPR
jgi:hypothetical protein